MPSPPSPPAAPAAPPPAVSDARILQALAATAGPAHAEQRRRLLAAVPERIERRFPLALAAHRGGHPEVALALLAPFADVPRSPVQNLIGLAAGRLKRTDAAARAFRRALCLGPDRPEGYANALTHTTLMPAHTGLRRANALGAVDAETVAHVLDRQRPETDWFRADDAEVAGWIDLQAGPDPSDTLYGAIVARFAFRSLAAAALAGPEAGARAFRRAGLPPPPGADARIRALILLDPQSPSPYMALFHYRRWSLEAASAADRRPMRHWARVHLLEAAWRARFGLADPPVRHQALLRAAIGTEIRVCDAAVDRRRIFGLAAEAFGLPPADRFPAPAVGAGDPLRRVGLYAGGSDSITATRFLPAAVSALADRGIATAVYFADAPDAAAASPLGRIVTDRGLDLRSFDGLADDAAAALIGGDGIGTYIDARGFSSDQRVALTARRPADLTLLLIGNGELCGRDFLDGIFTDRSLHVATDHARDLPPPIVLAGGLINYTPPPDFPDPAPLDESGGIRFAALHHWTKVTREAVDFWIRVLAAVDDSTLTVRAPQHPEDLQRLDALMQATARAAGVDPGRVRYDPQKPTWAAHIAALGAHDIALDCFPFAGQTTTFETLWAGVPLVSLAGRRMIARYGASILSHSGLPHLAGDTVAAGVEAAAALAADAPWRREFRTSGRQMLSRTPAFDPRLYGAGFAEGLETAARRLRRAP